MQLATIDLLTACRAGDREAFAALVVRYEGLVRAACQRQAPSPEIDDCVQAVFLILERRPAAAARAPALEAWLLRVACLVCRRAQRAARRRRRAEHAVATVAPLTIDDPESEALLHLDECLDKLPERQRVAVVMCYLSGQSATEVAERLNVSQANARQLLSRGLAHLRDQFARRGLTASVAVVPAMLGQQARSAAQPLSGSRLDHLLSSPPSPTAIHLCQGTLRIMFCKTFAPLLAALVLPVILTTAYFAAESNPAPPTVESNPTPPTAERNPSPPAAEATADIFTADAPSIHLSRAVWDGEDLIVSLSYAVPAGTAAEIECGIQSETSRGLEMVPHSQHPAPAGRGAFSYRLPVARGFRRYDSSKPLIIGAMLMPKVHDSPWSPLADDQKKVDPAWTTKPVTLTCVDLPLNQALVELARQSGAVLQLRDPQQRAKAIPITVAIRDLPLAEAIGMLARIGGGRTRLLTAGPTGYELSLTTDSPAPAAGVDAGKDVSTNDVSIVQARWQGPRLAVDIDYQIAATARAGATLSFALKRPGDEGAMVFERKSDLPQNPFSGSYLLESILLRTVSKHDRDAYALSAMLMSADGDLLSHAHYLIPPQSRCRPVAIDLHDADLADAVRKLGASGGVNIVLDDPLQRADSLRVTLKTTSLPLIDLLTIIEQLTGTIVHGSGENVIVTVPGILPPRAAPAASPKPVPHAEANRVPPKSERKTEF